MNKRLGFLSGNRMRTAAASLVAAFCFSTQTAATVSVPDAHKVMEDVYRQDSSHDTTMRASFQVFDKQGHSAKKEFTYRRLGSPGDGKTLVVFTAPAEIRGVALLSINQRGVSARQFIYTPATQRVRSVVAQERTARFIGTDFTFEDIAERILDDFTYRLIDDKETMDGRKTWKVEATPVDSSRSQYKYIYYWVAQDAPVILHAELYDAQSRQVRRLHASQIKHVDGVWGARHTEMSTVQDGTRTVLSIEEVKFNARLDEKLFTPQGLAEASATKAGK